MPKNILIILGHPAKERQSFCEALALAYKEGAESAGHEVKFLKIANLSFDPILHEGYKGEQSTEPDIKMAQDNMRWADHWVIIHPLWQFMIPALLKGFLERSLIKGFAYDFKENGSAIKPLKGKTARLIQTMGMPGFFYRWVFSAHGEKALKTMLKFCGLKPVSITYCGLAESPNEKRRIKYLQKVCALGKAGR